MTTALDTVARMPYAATMEPVTPAAVGTHRFTNTIGATYTAGRDYVEDVAREMLRRSDTLSLDIETDGSEGDDARYIKSVSFGLPDCAVVLDPRDPKQREIIRWVIKSARWLIIHSSTFDVPQLHINGLMTLEDIDKVIDTIIYCRMAEPSDIGGHDLLKAGNRYADLDAENYLLKAFKMLGLAKDKGFKVFDLDRLVYLQGAAADVVVTARIAPIVRRAAYDQTTKNHPFTNHGVFGSDAWRLVDREQRINRILLKRACRGIRVDLDYMDVYRAKTHAVRSEAERELAALGIEPSNGESLTAWLDANDQLPDDYPRTPTGKISAEAKTLETLTHPIAKMFVAQKKIVKIEKDYLQKAIDMAVKDANGDYRCFPTTAMLKAATGRAAMSAPPLHQFNGPARGILLADPGDEWSSIDWSQIEPVLVANLAGEMDMLVKYEDRTVKADTYERIAEMAGGIARKEAKVVLLATLYGEGKVKLGRQLGMKPDQAKALQGQIFSGIPRIEDFIYMMKDVGRRYKKIMTLSGRIIPIPMGVFDGEWSLQTHKAINYAVQGGAYDILAETIIAIDEANLSDALIFTMHDEIICSSSAAHDIQRIMETPPERLCYLSGRVPVLRTDRSEMGDRWAAEV